MENNFLSEMEAFFLALANKTRLRLLNLMRDREVCVYFLTEVLGASQPKVSRHLAYMRNAGIVEARRDGKWMNYRITKPRNEEAARVLQNTLDWLDSQESMQREHEKLMNIIYSPEASINVLKEHEAVILPQANIFYPAKNEIETFLL